MCRRQNPITDRNVKGTGTFGKRPLPFSLSPSPLPLPFLSLPRRLMKLSRIEKHTDFDKLEGYNPNRPSQENEAWVLYQKIPFRESWGDLLGTDISFAQSHPPLLEKYLIEGNCSPHICLLCDFHQKMAKSKGLQFSEPIMEGC